MVKIYDCELCPNNHFQSRNGLNNHKKNFHKVQLLSPMLKCCSCEESFHTQFNYAKHFSEIHDSSAKIEEFNFETNQKFHNRRLNVETARNFKFVKQFSSCSTTNKTIEYLRCFRSGPIRSTTTGINTLFCKYL